MRKELVKIVSVLLVLSMFCTCVYDTDNSTPNANNEGIQNQEEESQITYLDKPEIKSISVSGTTVTITYDAVENASKYIICYMDDGISVEKEESELSATLSDLNEDTTYSFQIKAVYESGETIIESELSDSKSITTGKIVLGRPVLKLEAYNKGATLIWNSVDYATSYEVWRCYNNKWSKIKTVDSSILKYRNTGLALNKKYTYKVRAIRVLNGETYGSQFSEWKSITAKAYLTSTTIRMGYDTGVVKRNSKKYKEGSTTQTVSETKLKKGTKVTILSHKKVGRHPMVYVKVSSGAKYWIKRCNVRFNAPYTTKDYTTEVKENFVNKKGYSSATKYLLFISHYTQRVYLFEGSKGNWDLKKTYRCAAGKASTRTPLGTYKLYKKAKRTLAGSKYASYFCLTNAFHAMPLGSKTMGKPASNGCIRMYNEDAIFIYKNMPIGTTVVSY